MYSVDYLITHTNTCTCIYIYILFQKSKIYIKTFKTLLHVSITRSSSGSIYCSLLKLQFKTVSELLRYVNLMLWQHVVFLCVSSTLFRMILFMVVRRMLCSVKLQSHAAQLILNSIRLTHKNTIFCHSTKLT